MDTEKRLEAIFNIRKALEAAETLAQLGTVAHIQPRGMKPLDLTPKVDTLVERLNAALAALAFRDEAGNPVYVFGDDSWPIGDVVYPRIPYGQEHRGGGDWHIDASGVVHACHDCCAEPGEYHTPGCDVEECPKCHGQAISCWCNEDMGEDTP